MVHVPHWVSRFFVEGRCKIVRAFHTFIDTIFIIHQPRTATMALSVRCESGWVEVKLKHVQRLICWTVGMRSSLATREARRTAQCTQPLTALSLHHATNVRTISHITDITATTA